MASTTFVDKVTTILASWLNEVNAHVWADTPASGSYVHSGDKISYVPSGTGAVTTNLQDKLKNTIPSVFDFMTPNEIANVSGLVGTTDVTAKLQAAIAAHPTILFPRGKYLVSGNNVLDVAAGSAWLMEGAEFLHTTSTQTTIRANTVDDWGILGEFKITGSGSTSGSAAGLSVLSCNRWRVENPTFNTVRGYGFYIEGGSASGSLRGDQGVILNPVCLSTYIGGNIETTAGAEYNTIIAPMITGCTTGMVVKGGNNTVVGGNIVDNTDGISLAAGGNHGHGMFQGVNINHNTQYNVRALNVTNGYDFNDCHLYGNGSGSGAIYLSNCKGIVFNGGHLDCWIYNDSGANSSWNYARNMYAPGTYTVKVTDTGAGKEQFIMLGLTGPGSLDSGINISDPSEVYVHARRLTTQSLTSSSPSDLIFNDVQTNGDRRNCYNETTGIFTVPTGQTGQYRIFVSVAFGGTTITPNYCDVNINSGGQYRAVPLSNYSTSLITGSGTFDVFLTDGNTVKCVANISGTSPVFGSTTYQSTFTVEKIS